MKHYTRFLRYGDAQKRIVPRGDARELFYKTLAYSGDDCVGWPYSTAGKEKRPWISLEGKRRGAVSRFMCEKAHGLPPTENHHAAHNCGNGHCINPRHLRWATCKENMADKLMHGTDAKGEKHGASKLTAADVMMIRSMAGEFSITEISKKFPVGRTQIKRIIRRERWMHV